MMFANLVIWVFFFVSIVLLCSRRVHKNPIVTLAVVGCFMLSLLLWVISVYALLAKLFIYLAF